MWWTGLFAFSLTALIIVLIRNRMSWSWLTRFGLQIVAAILLLYVLNYSGFISGFHIPLNPTTIAAVMLLGVPGILLILALQRVLL
jgi:inhibitor of the pro-sigma K processing machinery